MAYTAVQLHVLSSVSESLHEREQFIGAVERGEKPLDQRQALGIIRVSFDVEGKRTAAISAARDLMIVLAAISLAAVGALVIGIRSVPREHWPRVSMRGNSPA